MKEGNGFKQPAVTFHKDHSDMRACQTLCLNPSNQHVRLLSENMVVSCGTKMDFCRLRA